MAGPFVPQIPHEMEAMAKLPALYYTSPLELLSESPEGFGYLLKDRVMEIDEFLEAVRRVGRGGTAIDPQKRD